MSINYDTLLTSGSEMYNLPMFIRNFHIWKLTHLATRIVPITPKFQLPWNSVLHLLDNIQYPMTELRDTPRIETNPFVLHEKYRKWIFHVTDFKFSTEKDPCPIDINWESGTVSSEPTERKYIYRTARLQQNLIEFRRKYKGNFKYLLDTVSIPMMKESLVIINHNPLFRVTVFGKLRIFRRLQLIFASILNTACKISLAKNQYIHIPLTTNVFTKETFIKSQKELSLVSLKYPENYHYLMMMNFLNFANSSATTSLINNIPEDYRKVITFIFTVGDNALFYNLNDIKKLNEDGKAYIRLVNQMNLLAMSRRPEVKKILDSAIDESNADSESDADDSVNNTVNEIMDDVRKDILKANKFDNSAPNNTELDNALNKDIDISSELDTLKSESAHDPDNTGENSDAVVIPADEPTSMKESDEYEDFEDMPDEEYDDIDDTAADTQELIDLLVEHDKTYQENKRKNQISAGVIQAKREADRKSSKETTTIDLVDISNSIQTEPSGESINSPVTKNLDETPEQATIRAKQDLLEMEAEAETLIENLPDLTPAQKERYKKLSKVYRDVKVGNKTVSEWLETPPNASLKDVELDFLKDQIPDESMLKSSVLSLDDEYMQKTFGRDLLSVATSFTKNGVFLVDAQVEPITTELNKLVKYSFKYEDVNGKSSTVSLTIPQINKHGHLYVNGVKKIMKKQLANLPLVKVSNTRVSLSSAMNKTMIERSLIKKNAFDAHVITLLRKVARCKGVTVKFINSTIKINKPVAYEYTSLAKNYREISVYVGKNRLEFNFDYHNRLEHFSKNKKDLLEKITLFENKYKSVVFASHEGHLGFIDINNNINFMDSMGVILNQKKTTMIELIKSMATEKITTSPLAEFITHKIRDKNLPVMFELSYQYGFIATLNYIKCHWIRIGKTDKRVIQEYNAPSVQPPIPGVKTASEALSPGEKYTPRPNDILIPFNDEYVVINRYPLPQSLITAGITAFNTELFSFNDMEDPSTYFTLLEMKGYSTNYLKAITGFFSYFLDNMTKDKLAMMGEPTNCRDILIRCAQLLSTEDHRQASSMANHCLRSYERINAILYNEMSRALETYQISGGAGSKFTINPQAVLQKILTDQAITSVEELNPVHDIKERAGATYTGVGGRTSTSFVLKDRQFPDDGVGILSESTVDSGKVGIVAQMSANPTMTNTRGMFKTNDPSQLDPTQVLSTSSLLMPCVTNDDGKRMNFVSIQLSHHIPTEDGDVCRVRTGYERVIAHQSSSSFAGAARFDGTVTEVNPKIKMIKVEYDNGEIDVFSYADLYTGSSGLVIEQLIELAVEQGQRVKRGDILIYNKSFFKKDPYSTQVDWKHGVMANVVLAERNTTLEDSNGISKRLGKKFNIAPIEIVTAVLDSESMVHEILPVGTHVQQGDILCTFEDGSLGESATINVKDAETMAMIQQLNRTNTKATVSGTIVKIDALYGCPIAEMHPSLAKIVSSITKYKQARHKFSSETDAEYDNPMPGPLPKGDKYKQYDFTETTVILQFYIKHVVDAGVGDKLVYDSSLKSVISSTFKEPMLSETGVEIDAVFSGTGINHRTITSPLVVGTLQRVLEKVEMDMIDWWDKKKEPIDVSKKTTKIIPDIAKEDLDHVSESNISVGLESNSIQIAIEDNKNVPHMFQPIATNVNIDEHIDKFYSKMVNAYKKKHNDNRTIDKENVKKLMHQNLNNLILKKVNSIASKEYKMIKSTLPGIVSKIASIKSGTLKEFKITEQVWQQKYYVSTLSLLFECITNDQKFKDAVVSKPFPGRLAIGLLKGGQIDGKQLIKYLKDGGKPDIMAVDENDLVCKIEVGTHNQYGACYTFFSASTSGIKESDVKTIVAEFKKAYGSSAKKQETVTQQAMKQESQNML